MTTTETYLQEPRLLLGTEWRLHTLYVSPIAGKCVYSKGVTFKVEGVHSTGNFLRIEASSLKAVQQVLPDIIKFADQINMPTSLHVLQNTEYVCLSDKPRKFYRVVEIYDDKHTVLLQNEDGKKCEYPIDSNWQPAILNPLYRQIRGYMVNMWGIRLRTNDNGQYFAINNQKRFIEMNSEPDGLTYLGIKEDGATRTAFNGHVETLDQFKLILKLVL